MKRLKKILRYVLLTLCTLVGALLLFIALSIIPIDRTPSREKTIYPEMMSRLDSLKTISIPKASRGFAVGYAVENLTPSFRTATAGYGNRMGKDFSVVRDSIYVRAMVIDNGAQKIAIVSADLLIIPPTVTLLLEKELPSIGFDLDNTYLGAIHTHNSIGNWGHGAATFLYGSYNDSIVHFIADKIKQCIAAANQNILPATLKSGEIGIGEAVRNRIDKKNGGVDSLLRVIEVHRSDSSKLAMLSYTAHATCLYSADLALSRDYPGKLVDEVEQNGYAFAMFIAGAMGSHRCNPPEFGEVCINWMGDELTQKFLVHRNEFRKVQDSTLFMVRVPLALSEPQVKISEDWRLRPWLFKAAFGEYPVYLTALRLGDIVMLGTPCDFSGELTPALDSLAAQKGMHTMVTSFNGGYIGYITADEHYDTDHYETRLMNWYGPGNGAYLVECLRKLIEGVSR
jgi:hypothetical protein